MQNKTALYEATSPVASGEVVIVDYCTKVARIVFEKTELD